MFRPADRRKTAATHPDIDPRIERALRAWLLWGTVAVILLPMARGHTAWLGWLPMWLVAMPASAWWALHRFPLPRLADSQASSRMRRRRAPQARRRERGPRSARHLRAA